MTLFLKKFKTKYNSAPFSKINLSNFKEAFEKNIELARTEIDSILDLGLSKFEHREKFRKFARINNIEIKIHFLDISKETRLKRIFERNNAKGETFEFEVTQENFDFMESWFEKPTEKEMIGIMLADGLYNEGTKPYFISFTFFTSKHDIYCEGALSL